MIVQQAKEIARAWVIEEGSATPGFGGAFFHGSTNWLPDDAPLSATSDVDLMLVVDDHDPPLKPGKLIHRDVLLDVSLLSSDGLRSPQQVLSQYNLGGSFERPGIIADPGGWLTPLQAAVARDYAKRRWVARRCAHAREKVLSGFHLDEASSFPDQVVAWLFPAGILCHVLLVAGLKNPTVRRRYLAARELLADYGHLDLYETLLEILGCARMSRTRAEQHLATLTDAFDAAKMVVRSPFFFASDISDLARPIAIDGSRDLIAGGDHREALFWMVATASRCQSIFKRDGTAEMRARFDLPYRELLADLGITSFADLERRIGQVRAHLPQVCEVADAIMAANPGIQDDE